MSLYKIVESPLEELPPHKAEIGDLVIDLKKSNYDISTKNGSYEMKILRTGETEFFWECEIERADFIDIWEYKRRESI